MTGYVRNDTGNNIADGNIIDAADLDGEFDAVVAAFNNSTGHTHDGTTAEGAPITKVGPVQDLQVTASALLPKTDNTLDLGSSSYEFKDLYIDGTANIDSLVADTADINGGTIDGATITAPRIVTSIDDSNGNELVKLTATTSAVNEITVANAATTGKPTISATGGDTNISLNLVPKGSGAVQINGAAALFSGGALGTPSSGTLTNATGLPISTGVSGLGTNVATFLGTPSSANLAAALTDETGTGVAVFGTNPTLTGATMAGELACADQIVSRPTLKDYAIEGQAVGNTGATRTLDLNDANFFSATLDQACTFTFSDPPASGDFGAFVLELTNGGAFVATWPASVDWPGGTAPTLTASGVDQLVFTTRDGGTTYFGFVAGLDIKTPA